MLYNYFSGCFVLINLKENNINFVYFFSWFAVYNFYLKILWKYIRYKKLRVKEIGKKKNCMLNYILVTLIHGWFLFFG